jgi:hypothetical protein
MGVSGPISWVVNGLGSGLRAACQPAVGPCPAGIGLRKNLRAVRTTTTGRGQVRRAQDRAGSGFPGAQPQRGSPNRAFLVIVEAASPQVAPLCSRAPEAGGHPPKWLAETAEFPPETSMACRARGDPWNSPRWPRHGDITRCAIAEAARVRARSYTVLRCFTDSRRRRSARGPIPSLSVSRAIEPWVARYRLDKFTPRQCPERLVHPPARRQAHTGRGERARSPAGGWPAPSTEIPHNSPSLPTECHPKRYPG